MVAYDSVLASRGNDKGTVKVHNRKNFSTLLKKVLGDIEINLYKYFNQRGKMIAGALLQIVK